MNNIELISAIVASALAYCHTTLMTAGYTSCFP